ncbi:MAG: molybdopterin-guanine dinucleotide biosynthesis protein [Nocardioidaceae bacterium]|jgi:hypothetical protein|nr:molybdopterin-guanine dinucleotide biosynthesis protein [Nocardioidaceae bacterium]
MTLQEWVEALCAELGVPADDVDVPLLLDAARDAAHSVARPAAPLTTFLIGYAAAARGGGSGAIRTAAEQAVRLALAGGTGSGQADDAAATGPARDTSTDEKPEERTD